MISETTKKVPILFQIVLLLLFFEVNAFIVGKNGNYAVLRGATFKISCIPKDVEITVPETASFVWTNEEGKELIDARYTKLENGDLEIANAHISDSGTYKCKFRSSSEGGLSKMYDHKLVVYELSGHKFVSSAFFDVSKYSKEMILTMLKDLISISVCSRELCVPGTVKSPKCELSEIKERVCEFTISYEAMSQIADDSCDEECVRERMFESLKKAERILESELLRMAEDPRGRLKADLKTFDTKHLITCRAGFHLVKAHYKRCFPCLPGYYSEANSVKCNMCNIGFYQEHYGKRDCDKCDEGKTTDTMGAKSRDDCIAQEDKGVLEDLKEGIISIFSGR